MYLPTPTLTPTPSHAILARPSAHAMPCHRRWVAGTAAASRREDACRQDGQMPSSMQAPLSVHGQSGSARCLCNNSSRSSDEKLGRLPLCVPLSSTCQRCAEWHPLVGLVIGCQHRDVSLPAEVGAAPIHHDVSVPKTLASEGVQGFLHPDPDDDVLMLLMLPMPMPCPCPALPSLYSQPAARRDACQMTAVALPWGQSAIADGHGCVAAQRPHSLLTASAAAA